MNRKLLIRDSNLGLEIIDLFQSAYYDYPYEKIVSIIYEILQNIKGDNTLNIKARWETEGNLIITAEDWDRICEHQWKMTCSPTWREFSWKNVTRFFCTPAQKSKYSIQSDCWRACGETLANHFHIFWSCHFGEVFTVSWRPLLESQFNLILKPCT